MWYSGLLATRDGKRASVRPRSGFMEPWYLFIEASGIRVKMWRVTGVLAYELIVGYPCFETQSNEATFQKITTVFIMI